MRQKVLTEAEILKIGRKRIDRQTPEEKQILLDYWEDRLKKMGESEDRARAPIHIAQTELGEWSSDEDTEEIRPSGDGLPGEDEDVQAVFQAESARKPHGKPRKVFRELNSMESNT